MGVEHFCWNKTHAMLSAFMKTIITKPVKKYQNRVSLALHGSCQHKPGCSCQLPTKKGR
jgi:hypothetical protein